jgi:hypothetical protein
MLLTFKGELVNKIVSKTLLLLAAVFIFTSCTKNPIGNKEIQAPIQPLSCIAVLPAITSVDSDNTIGYEAARALEKGAAFATSVMSAELIGNDKVRVLNSAQVSELVPEVSGGISGTIAALGKKVNCDGVLVTVVQRFKQRVGTELAVEAPASAKFHMILRHSESGAVLWTADFKETQQSYLSNIFSFGKAKKRGFKWISVEDLVKQGIVEKLGECPYL